MADIEGGKDQSGGGTEEGIGFHKQLNINTTETAVTLMWRQFVLNLDMASTSYAMPIKSKTVQICFSTVERL